MTDFLEFRRNIGLFITGLKHSIDRPFRLLSRGNEAYREDHMKMMLLVEEARLRTYLYSGFRGDLSPESWAETRDKLIKFADKLLESGEEFPGYLDRIYRFPSSAMNEDVRSFLGMSIDDTPVPIREAVTRFRAELDGYSDYGGPQQVLEFSDLKTIVPQQQIAPARFAVVENRIVLADQEPVTEEIDRENISAALAHLQTVGHGLISSLELSNCDRRLLDSVKDLHSQVSSNDNIVKIGLMNMGCSFMVEQFRQELPDAICGIFTAYNSSISMYVAQFPEWEQFTSKAAGIEFSDEDVSEIAETASDLIDTLTAQPELADPKVPQMIKLVRELMSQPGRSAQRAAYAMLRTIENLVASIITHSLSVVSKTVDKTINSVSTTVAATISALLAVALVGAAGAASTAVQAGAPWLGRAAELVQQQINRSAEIGKLATTD